MLVLSSSVGNISPEDACSFESAGCGCWLTCGAVAVSATGTGRDSSASAARTIAGADDRNVATTFLATATKAGFFLSTSVGTAVTLGFAAGFLLSPAALVGSVAAGGSSVLRAGSVIDEIEGSSSK